MGLPVRELETLPTSELIPLLRSRLNVEVDVEQHEFINVSTVMHDNGLFSVYGTDDDILFLISDSVNAAEAVRRISTLLPDIPYAVSVYNDYGFSNYWIDGETYKKLSSGDMHENDLVRDTFVVCNEQIFNELFTDYEQLKYDPSIPGCDCDQGYSRRG